MFFKSNSSVLKRLAIEHRVTEVTIALQLRLLKVTRNKKKSIFHFPHLLTAKIAILCIFSQDIYEMKIKLDSVISLNFYVK